VLKQLWPARSNKQRVPRTVLVDLNCTIQIGYLFEDGSVKSTHQAKVVFKSWKRAVTVWAPKELLQLREFLLRQH
jgi:hypothetical protein